MPEQGATRAPQNLERKLATILSADVAGFSRLMAEDEEQTLKTFRAHKAVFESLVSMHKGRIFNTAGDAILAEFGSAVEAVRCATEIQAALETRNHQLPPERQVKFRIGVNLGDVMVQGDDLLGDGVNVAARLQTAAEPGGICISGSVYDQIRNKLSLAFNSLGEKSYKNIPVPIRTFSIAESEDRRPLPAARPSGTVKTKRIAAAVVLIVLTGGAFWAYRNKGSSKQTGKVSGPANSGASAEAPKPAETTPRVENPAETPRSQQRLRAEAKPSNSSAATLSNSETPAGASAFHSANTQNGASRPRSQPKTTTNGVYLGDLCYGGLDGQPGKCFKASGILSHGRLTGQWPGFIPGMTVYLEGDVSGAGEAQIHI
ncbi:MAG: adenylate/guanylate cyclase domain-containing protein, partial [Acidobacteriaceae bacterium]|nr:adenylate/guanylate cyclase domain-containing protein [Acidobacteriaceae bacterium]